MEDMYWTVATGSHLKQARVDIYAHARGAQYGLVVRNFLHLQELKLVKELVALVPVPCAIPDFRKITRLFKATSWEG